MPTLVKRSENRKSEIINVNFIGIQWRPLTYRLIISSLGADEITKLFTACAFSRSVKWLKLFNEEMKE